MKVPIPRVCLLGLVLLRPGEEVIEDGGDGVSINGVAFCLRFRHNLVILMKGLLPACPKEETPPCGERIGFCGPFHTRPRTTGHDEDSDISRPEQGFFLKRVDTKQ
jgi:hypothetical protein